MIPRQVWCLACAFVLLLPAAACHRPKTFVSVLQMADPATADQLTGGFYFVENNGDKRNGWRWTGGNFSLALAPPRTAPRGSRLVLRLYFPETQVQKLGPTTLSAFVDGAALTPETFTKGGNYELVRDIPACFLETNILPFSFYVSPYSPPSETDGRELGVVVLMAALEAR